MSGSSIFQLVALAASAATSPETAFTPCSGLTDCVIEERWSAAKAADGSSLEVVATSWPARSGDGTECQGGASAYWLHRGTEQDWRRLLRLCNDGYGASGVGEDHVTVEAGMLLHHRYGGSNWRGATDTRIALDPPRIVSISADYTVASSPGCHRQVTDLVKLERTGWLEPVSNDESERSDCAFDRPPDYRSIPLLNSTFVNEQQRPAVLQEFSRWQAQKIALGDCALEFSAQPGSGFVLHGKTAGAGAKVRAVALDELHWIVGVRTDRVPASSSRWINDDRLELWIGSFLFTWPDDITEPRQYGIRLADAAVFPGSKAGPALPEVRRWERAGWLWFSVDFSPVQEDYGIFSASVVYGQGDGKSQGLMLGSSAVRFGEASSLGDLWSDYPYACELRDGELRRSQLKPEFADPDHHDPLAIDE